MQLRACDDYLLLERSSILMLNFSDQQKLLDPLLKNKRNEHCADCDTISPTWASLDFGVFVCTNCSGAHRALGPTITRVRSASLDKWDREWVANMLLGNLQLNKFWESDPRAQDRKPKLGSTLDEIKRYVFEKYVKRKFVKDPNTTDPLTSYKNGNYQISKEESPAQPQPTPAKPQPVSVQVAPQAEPKPAKPKAEISLLDFDMDLGHHQPTPQHPQLYKPVQPVVSVQQAPPVQPVQQVADDDEFTDYTQPGSVAKDEGVISFDALMNQHKQVPQQPQYQSYNGLKAQNMALHHPYNHNIAQHNLVYNSHFPPQQQYHTPFHSYSAQPSYPAAHNYSPAGHGYLAHNTGYPQPQQYNNIGYINQVGVGNYWK